jgi:hypothetical protein
MIGLLGPLGLGFLPFSGSCTAPRAFHERVTSQDYNKYKKIAVFLLKKILPYYFVAKAISDPIILLPSLSTFLSVFSTSLLEGKSKIKL